jgi:hypothetical protein
MENTQGTKTMNLNPQQSSAKDEILKALRNNDVDGANSLFWQAADQMSEDECVEVMQAISLEEYA